MPPTASCRSCGAGLGATFVDLGLSPPSNAIVEPEDLAAGERFYPLHVYVCERCFLVQLEEFESPEQIFRDYAYFSSYSSTWLRHAEIYATAMVERRGIGPGKQVVEIASNDGYLLKNFVRRGIEVLGIEPARNVAAVAREQGVPTLDEFFGVDLARSLVADRGTADLIIGNNVLAHVPNLNDFVGGLSILVADDGFITIEFPHVLRLIAGMQFDTIYHEHFSYLSILAIEPLFARHRLAVFEVEELPTHGGSLRVYAARTGVRPRDPSVDGILAAERAAALDQVGTYAAFGERVATIKCDFLDALIGARRAGKLVAGYGAAAKATTLLNYAGAGAELIAYVADKNPRKQARYVPGVRVPIVAPNRIAADRPDVVVIFPWNIADEIRAELAAVPSWGGRFLTAIPHVAFS